MSDKEYDIVPRFILFRVERQSDARSERMSKKSWRRTLKSLDGVEWRREFQIDWPSGFGADYWQTRATASGSIGDVGNGAKRSGVSVLSVSDTKSGWLGQIDQLTIMPLHENSSLLYTVSVDGVLTVFNSQLKDKRIPHRNIFDAIAPNLLV